MRESVHACRSSDPSSALSPGVLERNLQETVYSPAKPHALHIVNLDKSPRCSDRPRTMFCEEVGQ